ncbi:hypothetical protein [Vibrio splendidus]|uniref:hypothetical protein n=1 Tax=Vibrio splendidus TaxID=29497 RepID=UPI000C860235|nr:hypothetical protein [Vibrio splendidus]PMI54474.1 hypothetical protein BCU42_17855 [Vibrio splendidus]
MFKLFNKTLTDYQRLEIVTNICQHFDNSVTSSKTSNIRRELNGMMSMAKSLEAIPEGSEVEIVTLNHIEGLILKKVNGEIIVTKND